MCNGTMLTHLQFHLVNWFWPADVGVEAASDTRSCATTRLVYRDAQNARYWPSVFILRWAAAPQQPRLRLPESPPGRQRQRTADAPPTPPDPAGRRVCTHKHTHTHTHTLMTDCWLFVTISQSVNTSRYLWCRCSNSLQRSRLLIGVGTATISSFTLVSSTLLAKYNTHTWGSTTHTHTPEEEQHTHTWGRTTQTQYYNTHTRGSTTTHTHTLSGRHIMKLMMLISWSESRRVSLSHRSRSLLRFRSGPPAGPGAAVT